ncbi:MAG: M48 family metallopeptidase [Gammaproteobacteria bacterium]|nr:M48 family metallopeptidase [Gammaproteobacteria bacterium]
MDNKIKARFFDGKKIQESQAWVDIDPVGLKISYEENNIKQEIIWPKEVLQLLERLYHDKPSVFGCKTMLGARLVVENAADYELIKPLVLKRNIKLSHVHHPWRITWMLIAAIILIIALSISHSHMLSLVVANLIPYSWEEKIWDNEIKPYINQDAFECVSPEGKKALTKMIAKLEAHIPSKHTFDIRVINSPEFDNAESLPGFHIYIYSGILRMNSPDALAGVLAHEMGHSVKHHSVALFINLMGMNAFLKSILGLSDSSIALKFINLKYSRDYERQADDFSIELMKKANANPAGLRFSMEYLLKNSRDFEGIEAYLLDHPTFGERIENIKSKENVVNPEPILTSQEWKELQSICKKKIPLHYD